LVADFRDYKSGQERLQIEKSFGLQIGEKGITNQDRDYKLGQKELQIRAGITIWCRTQR